MATPGLVSARLVTVEIAESGVSKERIWVLLSNDAACLPGAELISDRFFSTIGAPIERGRSLPPAGFGTSRTTCQPGKVMAIVREDRTIDTRRKVERS